LHVIHFELRFWKWNGIQKIRQHKSNVIRNIVKHRTMDPIDRRCCMLMEVSCSVLFLDYLSVFQHLCNCCKTVTITRELKRDLRKSVSPTRV
jgi:hypothetical protein